MKRNTTQMKLSHDTTGKYPAGIFEPIKVKDNIDIEQIVFNLGVSKRFTQGANDHIKHQYDERNICNKNKKFNKLTAIETRHNNRQAKRNVIPTKLTTSRRIESKVDCHRHSTSTIPCPAQQRDADRAFSS